MQFEDITAQGRGNKVISMENEFTQIMTVSDAATMLRVPKSWIYERTRRRGNERIPHKKLGKYLRFQENELRNWFTNLPEN
jgi:excisionase family DNA binding protein